MSKFLLFATVLFLVLVCSRASAVCDIRQEGGSFSRCIQQQNERHDNERSRRQVQKNQENIWADLARDRREQAKLKRDLAAQVKRVEKLRRELEENR